MWLDDYKHLLYRNDPGRFATIDEGDLTKEKEMRKSCKPFHYFLESVAPDMLERYPVEDLGEFASGVIQSEASSDLCVDALNKKNGKPLDLRPCSKNLISPKIDTQNYVLTWHRQIKKNDIYDFCMEPSFAKKTVSLQVKYLEIQQLKRF